MDRRVARRVILREVGEIEQVRNGLEATVTEIDAGGDPILSGELRRFLEKLTDTLDAMYVWAGNI